MENIIIGILITLLAVAIIKEYKMHQDKKTISNIDTETEEFNLENESNEIIQTVCIQEQNFTTQDIREECNKLNDKIALTNILLLIIAIALIVIAYCTVQDFLYKKEIINNTNSIINEILEIIN